MEEHLRPCPFCGAEDGIEPYDFAPNRVVFQCAACSAEGPPAIKQTLAEAAAAWNRREPDWERRYGELVEIIARRTGQAARKKK